MAKGIIMENPSTNLIKIQTHKEINSLLKTFLMIIEDIKNNHDIMLKKAQINVDASYLNDINYFTPQFFEQLRKRVLDYSNDTDRSILAFLDYFDFTINKEKVQEAASKQKITKKIVIGSVMDYNR